MPADGSKPLDIDTDNADPGEPKDTGASDTGARDTGALDTGAPDSGAADPGPGTIEPAEAEPGEGRPRVRVVDLDGKSVIVAFVTVLALLAFAAVATSGTVTTLVVVAALFAFGIDPLIVLIETRLRMRRGFAVALFMGSLFLVVALGIAVLGPQTVDQARSFQEDLPHVVSDLGSLPLVGDQLVSNDVPKKIEDWAAQLPRQLSGETSQITNVAENVTNLVLAGLGVGLIMIAFLVDGPWLIAGARRVVPADRRDTFESLGSIVGRVIGRYFAGSLVLATAQGFQVLITGLILGVPLSPLLAVWAAVWNLVPQVGGAIGGIVFVLVAFTQGATTGLIAAAVFMAYITFSNNVLLPVILGKAVDISPLSTMAATIAGFFAAGIVGAMLAVPLLGAGKAMYNELRRIEREERPRRPGNVERVAKLVRRPAPT